MSSLGDPRYGMMLMKPSRTLLMWAGLCTVAIPLSNVYAGGYATARFGGEHGHPATDHPTAIYYNPAGLAAGKGTRIYVEGLLVHRTASYERPTGAIDDEGGGTPANAIDANSGKSELSNILASPFLGVASDLGIDNLGVGLAFYAPFGGQASWGTDDQFDGNQQYPGAVDGAQRWHSIDGAQRVLYVTLGAAYRLPGNLTIGVGLNGVMQSLETLRARNLDGTDDLVSLDGGVKEGRTYTEGSQNTFSIGVGVQWAPNDKLRIGASYQSVPGFGESKLEGQLITKFGSSPAGVPTDTVLLLQLPDIFRFGLSYRVSPKIEVRLAGDYTRWGMFDQHCLLTRVDDPECTLNEDGSIDTLSEGASALLAVVRNWKDTFGVRVGGSYFASSALEAFAGVGFDSSAVPDETMEAGLMDMNKIVSSAGVRYALMDKTLTLTSAFTNVFYMSRDIDVRGPMDAPVSPSASPDGAGKYSQSINLLTLGAEYAF